MDGSDVWRRRGSVAFVVGLGGVTLLGHAYHLVTGDLPLLAVVFGVAIPMVVSATLVACGVWLARADFGALSSRVASWSFAGGLVLVALACANVAFQRSAGGDLETVSVVIVVQGSVGALLGFLLGVYDVQRLRTRRHLVDERETASRLSRRLNVLNRVLRHDIRNKVSVIRGNADLVASGSGQTETAAETIKEQADELFRLSEYARELEAVLARDDVETEPVDVGTAVSAKAMRLRRDHEYAMVHVDVDVADDGGAWAEANAFVDSAIENLLENAIEHNDGASPTVWIDVSTEEQVLDGTDDDGGDGVGDSESFDGTVGDHGARAGSTAAAPSGVPHVEDEVDEDGSGGTVRSRNGTDAVVGTEVVTVRVADDGPGIPPEEVAVLQRGRETSLEHASGLGLWLVHWIVTESGGTVSFEEREPRGSVVELALPRTDPPENAAATESPSRTTDEAAADDD